MSSLFGDELLNDNLNGNLDELPSDDDEGHGEKLFADGDEAAGGGDGEGAANGEPNAVKVEPKKRSVRNPRPRLTVETLRGQRGIQTIEEYFKDVKFKGKGYEKHDLDEIMRRLQHWGHRMYPTYKFGDVLANIERLGKKKPLQVHMSRYRLGMLEQLKLSDEQHGLEDDEDGAAQAADEPFDEFDALLGEQIAISKLAPRTPAPNSTHRLSTGGGGGGGAGGYSAANHFMASSSSNNTFQTPSFARPHAAMSTPFSSAHDTSDLATPLPPSQPATPEPSKKLSAEQLAKIAENRRLAQERLRAKQKQQEIEADV